LKLLQSGRYCEERNDVAYFNVQYLKRVEGCLKQHKIPSAKSEAEQLVRHFSGISRVDFFTGQKTISPRARKSITAALKTRIKGKPLAYILKEAEFFGLKFFVSSDTLCPRPETEILAEAALKVMRSLDFPSTGFARLGSLGTTAKQPRPRALEILDIGTGCGCLAVGLTIQRSNGRMTALDISSKALKIARKNINFYRLGKKIRLVKSDLFGVFGNKKKAFWDVIVSNPPYVPEEDFGGLSKEVLSEPPVALDGGPRGLSVLTRILDEAPYFMKKNGWLVMEIGDGQARPLQAKIAQDKIFYNSRLVQDLNGIDRVLMAQKWIN